MKKLFSIIKNEFNVFFHDSGAMLIMIIGVIAYSIFYSLPYSTEVIKDVPVGVVDLDGTSMSREYIRELDATDSVQIAEKFADVNDAKNTFYENKIKAYVVVPKNFEKDLLKGKQAHISLYADSSYLIIYKQVVSGTVSTAVSMGAKIEVAKLMKAGMSKQMAMTIKQPFEFVSTAMYNPAGGYATYVFPVILIMILHQTLIIGVGLILGTNNEKRRLLCPENGGVAINLFGRATAYVLLYLFYSIFFFIFYPAVVNYPMTYNLVPLFMIIVPMFYAAVFFAHAISVLFETRESSLLFLVVTSLVAIFLPGFIWPKEAIPTIVNIVSYLIPSTAGVDGIMKINQMGATFWDVKHDFIILVGLCIFYFGVALRVIKSKNAICKSED